MRYFLTFMLCFAFCWPAFAVWDKTKPVSLTNQGPKAGVDVPNYLDDYRKKKEAEKAAARAQRNMAPATVKPEE